MKPAHNIYSLFTAFQRVEGVPSDQLEERMVRFSAEREAYALVYKYHEVLVGKIVRGKLFFFKERSLEPEYVTEVRVFDEEGELYFWRNEDHFDGRIRLDRNHSNLISGSEWERRRVYEEKHGVWGRVQNSSLEEWLEVKERGRGFTLVFPRIGMLRNADKDAKIFYLVRNYLDYDEDGLIRFVDARLCGFYPGKSIAKGE